MMASPRSGLASSFSSKKKMADQVSPLSVLGPQCDAQRERIRKLFDNGASAQDTLRQLCELADGTIQQVFVELFRVRQLTPQGLCLLALGGYGREMLFPYSDLDLLFLFGNEKAEEEFRPLIAEFSRTLWDLGFRVSSAGRTLDECRRIEEDNAEFHLAMLDRRFLDGDATLFEKLDAKVLSGPERQARPFLLNELQRLTRDRLNRYGNTIFHLEPNVKEAPGGLRDYHATLWMRQLAGDRRDPRISPVNEDELTRNAVEFLSSIRCFLHYSNARNDNTLTYELQAGAAERSLGIDDNLRRNAAEWMRLYFRHARTLNRQLLRYMEQRPPATISLRQRLMNATLGGRPEATNGKPFMVRDGLLEMTNEQAYADRSVTYSLLTEASRAGIQVSRESERSIAYIMTHPELPQRNSRVAWPVLSEILGADFPGMALRPMHRLGLLTEVLPEFRNIDSLVVRDFYHRYTVDEHSLRTIEHLQELAEPPDPRGLHFTQLWRTVERRDLLILSLLLHDIGKGMPVENHVAGSLQALETAADRLKLEPEEKAEVHFLIEHHLDMSATVQRRDIFDPSTVSAFATNVGTHERLQRLCLLTYADIHAVNPEALTPWKAEMLWQLFVATSNHFSRTLDRDRLHASDEAFLLEQVRQQAVGASKAEIERFLEGFPRRYLAVHSPAEIASALLFVPKVGSRTRTNGNQADPSRVYTDPTFRGPARAVCVDCGGACGMGNEHRQGGCVRKRGRSCTRHISLRRYAPHSGTESRRNSAVPAEHCGRRERKAGARAAIEGTAGGCTCAAAKGRGANVAEFRRCVVRSVHADGNRHAGPAWTAVWDWLCVARLACNIEVALIDTEGQKAIDVFYLTSQGKKLVPQKQELLREVLNATLS